MPLRAVAIAASLTFSTVTYVRLTLELTYDDLSEDLQLSFQLMCNRASHEEVRLLPLHRRACFDLGIVEQCYFLGRAQFLALRASATRRTVHA